MKDREQLENVNLSAIQFGADGDSVTLHLVDMLPPHKNSLFVCENVFSFILHRSPDDHIPYYVGELVWRELSQGEKQAALEKVGYPIIDQQGTFFVLKAKIVSVHVEGGICAEILAGSVRFDDAPGIADKPYRRRVDASGNPISPDDPGEFVSPLPGN